MKIEINNLTSLIQGRDLNLYQRSLAVEEWYKLINHVDEMEQVLSLGAVVERSEQLKCQCKKAQFTRTVDADFNPLCGRCGKAL